MSEFDLWVEQELGRIVAYTPDTQEALRWDPPRVLRRISASAGVNSIAAFAEKIGNSKVTAWYWFTGRAKPSLRFTLHICHRFGVSLSEMLKRPDRLVSLQHERQTELYLPGRRFVRFRNWTEIEGHLRAALKVPLECAEPLAAITRTHHIAARTIRAHFPRLCRSIAQRHRRRLHAEARRRQQLLRREISQAIGRLLRRNLPIRQATIALEMGRPSLFCRHNARALLVELCKNLGRFD